MKDIQPPLQLDNEIRFTSHHFTLIRPSRIKISDNNILAPAGGPVVVCVWEMRGERSEMGIYFLASVSFRPEGCNVPLPMAMGTSKILKYTVKNTHNHLCLPFSLPLVQCWVYVISLSQ